MAEDVYALTRELGIEQLVDIGHSMGNAVGLRLAAKHPEAVRAAVSIAGVPAAGMPESTRPLTSAIVTLLGNEEQFTAALAELFVHEDMESVIKASGISAALVQAAPLAGIAETELYLDESEQIVPALTQPWLFLIPGDDAAIPADAQLAGARAIPGARIIWFNGEGHIFPQERPGEAATVIRMFLDNLPAARS